MEKSIALLIAGDFVPNDRTAQIISDGRYEALFASDVIDCVSSVDYAVVNLEAPIAPKGGKPIKKVGPTLKAHDNSAKALRYAGFRMATLANNHVNDYGSEGVLNTIARCEQEGLTIIGAGDNRSIAMRTIIETIGGKKVAFINCCEHEFSITEQDKPGCNPLDPIAQSYAIKDAKKNVDYVIVIVHGGIEHYQLPTPRMQQTYRFFIDAGADAVVNHHQHCYSGYEVYSGKPIMYGLGNFCFDWYSRDSKKWREGCMVQLTLGQKVGFELIPYIQNDSQTGVRLMNEEEKKCFQTDILRLNNIINDTERLAQEYEKFLCNTDREMRAVLSLYPGRILTALCRKGFLPVWSNSYRFRRMWLNISCESHVERLRHYLKSNF